jgi:hypothetical protein
VSLQVVLKDERPTSNVQRRTSNIDVAALRNLISFIYISVAFQPFDSAQGRKPVENPELVEVVERPF